MCRLFIRHDNHLTHVSVVTDPIYLSEPLIKSEDYVLNTNSGGNWLWPCEYVEELPNSDLTKVPSFMPGQNPFAGPTGLFSVAMSKAIAKRISCRSTTTMKST